MGLFSPINLNTYCLVKYKQVKHNKEKKII